MEYTPQRGGANLLSPESFNDDYVSYNKDTQLLTIPKGTFTSTATNTLLYLIPVFFPARQKVAFISEILQGKLSSGKIIIGCYEVIMKSVGGYWRGSTTISDTGTDLSGQTNVDNAFALSDTEEIYFGYSIAAKTVIETDIICRIMYTTEEKTKWEPYGEPSTSFR